MLDTKQATSWLYYKLPSQVAKHKVQQGDIHQAMEMQLVRHWRIAKIAGGSGWREKSIIIPECSGDVAGSPDLLEKRKGYSIVLQKITEE